ncbi:MAG: hypothetical protein NC048_06690 [Bacteroides sp.]|nr:hypothetical protein [Ruminococcus flavefaciens]MCM1555166.1 hypothetical protein [Bacteroides sp.]
MGLFKTQGVWGAKRVGTDQCKDRENIRGGLIRGLSIPYGLGLKDDIKDWGFFLSRFVGVGCGNDAFL